LILLLLLQMLYQCLLFILLPHKRKIKTITKGNTFIYYSWGGSTCIFAYFNQEIQKEE
jgi:hypothetical protein